MNALSLVGNERAFSVDGAENKSRNLGFGLRLEIWGGLCNFLMLCVLCGSCIYFVILS